MSKKTPPSNEELLLLLLLTLLTVVLPPVGAVVLLCIVFSDGTKEGVLGCLSPFLVLIVIALLVNSCSG